MKYVDSFLEEFKKTPIFTISDTTKFLKYNGSTGTYPTVFIAQMIRSGRVHKITRGVYTLYKDIELVGFAFCPFYYGLGFALTKHKLWKQQANPYVLTIRNVRRGTRQAFGLNFTVSRISKDMFFGYYYIKGQNAYYPISDIEKTLIDCIYYRLNLEDYVYGNIFQKLDAQKMNGYLKKCNKRVRIKYNVLKELHFKGGPEAMNPNYAEDVRKLLKRQAKGKKLKKVIKEIEGFRMKTAKKAGVTTSSADTIRGDRERGQTRCRE